MSIHTYAENVHSVVGIAPQANGAELTGDFVSFKNANHIAVVCAIKQGNSTPVEIFLEQAKSVDGTGATALTKPVPIFEVANALSTDVPVHLDTDAVNHNSGAELADKLVVFEVDVMSLDINDGFTCLRAKAAASNAANIVSVNYVATGLRYGAGKSMVTD